ncbi:Bcr/CflA family multidrug efflux MFS transporter|uniref:Bcr/CflA family efflux transporter n=1 Tax=Dendrosporobacter quercicolus TaxID=146817 RepID=A0A1G9XHV9_9FIRM|nr:Bcr/CflA family multidrug efflux MFS transporter [Dendrosporobacter quercicolus]NSL49665.1 Bcr/CflA family multidrug efflux MFS transporter [Dendrosporobacter quercicolus DSM 1736]SDM96121.1 MFS transporter, DHA1 family, bicyclomycin/chloramphenicol resistance protein [Dendrosporobacter quercicolus]
MSYDHQTTAAAAVEQPSRRQVLWMAFVLGTLAAFGPLSIDMYLPALPHLVRDLHSTTSLAQLSLTACLLGIALGQIFVGPVSDVLGRKGPLMAGLAFYVLSSLLCVVAPTIELFIVMRFIQGLAGSAGVVISRAAVRDLYSGPELTRFFSLLMLVNGVAPVIAPVLGGQVLQFTSWRGIFVILTGLGVIMAAVVLWGFRETLPLSLRSKGGLDNTLHGFRDLIHNRKFMGYALVQGFSIAAMFAYISGSPFVLQNMFNVSPQMFSLLFAINSIGIIIASQMTGRLAGRIREGKLLISGLTLAFFSSLVLLVTTLLGGGLYTLLIPLFFTVASVGIIGTSSFSLAMQDQARAAGSASALIGLLSFVLGGVMAPFVGIAGSHTALPMAVTIAVAETAAVFCYWSLVAKSGKSN